MQIRPSAEPLFLIPIEPDDLEAELLEEMEENKHKANVFPVVDVWVKEREVVEEIV